MLTQSKIAALKPKERKYYVADSDNLLLCVYPSGAKSYFYNYKCAKTLKFKRKKLGSYPQMSIKRARNERNNLKLALESLNLSTLQASIPVQILSPLNSTQAFYNSAQALLSQAQIFSNSAQMPKVPSFKSLALEKMASKKGELASTTYKSLMSILTRFAFKFYAQKPINCVLAKDLLASFEHLKNLGIKSSANKLFALLGEIFRYALMQGYITQNPMQSLSRKDLIFKKPTKHFATLTHKKDIQSLLQGVLRLKCEKNTKMAIFMLALTAQRSANVRQSAWSELDFKRCLWHIPPEKMKARRAHKVALSSQMLFLLREFRQSKLDTGSGALFASSKSKYKIISENTIRRAFRRLGYSGDEFVPHGFRAMFSTICHEHRREHRVSSDIIEQCLAHSERDKVKASYNHASNLKEKARLMQWWGDYLDALFDFKAHAGAIFGDS